MAQQIVIRKIADLRPYAGNARTHSRKQIDQIAKSIERFGFTNPVLIADDGEILAGHGRVVRLSRSAFRVRRPSRRCAPALRTAHGSGVIIAASPGAFGCRSNAPMFGGGPTEERG